MKTMGNYRPFALYAIILLIELHPHPLRLFPEVDLKGSIFIVFKENTKSALKHNIKKELK